MVMETHRKQDYADMMMNQYLIELRLEPYRFCLVWYRLTGTRLHEGGNKYSIQKR